jgi:hypothetical protein
VIGFPPSHLELGSGLTPAHRVYHTPPKPALWRAELASCLSPVLNGQHSRSIFSVHGISRDASVQSVGHVPRQIGGSDDLYLRHLSHGPIGCRGNLQSAGNASSPLYCPARHFCRALLSGTRGTSSSSPRLSKQADASQLKDFAASDIPGNLECHKFATHGPGAVARRALELSVLVCSGAMVASLFWCSSPDLPSRAGMTQIRGMESLHHFAFLARPSCIRWQH